MHFGQLGVDLLESFVFSVLYSVENGLEVFPLVADTFCIQIQETGQRDEVVQVEVGLFGEVLQVQVQLVLRGEGFVALDMVYELLAAVLAQVLVLDSVGSRLPLEVEQRVKGLSLFPLRLLSCFVENSPHKVGVIAVPHYELECVGFGLLLLGELRILLFHFKSELLHPFLLPLDVQVGMEDFSQYLVLCCYLGRSQLLLLRNRIYLVLLLVFRFIKGTFYIRKRNLVCLLNHFAYFFLYLGHERLLFYFFNELLRNLYVVLYGHVGTGFSVLRRGSLLLYWCHRAHFVLLSFLLYYLSDWDELAFDCRFLYLGEP